MPLRCPKPRINYVTNHYMLWQCTSIVYIYWTLCSAHCLCYRQPMLYSYWHNVCTSACAIPLHCFNFKGLVYLSFAFQIFINLTPTHYSDRNFMLTIPVGFTCITLFKYIIHYVICLIIRLISLFTKFISWPFLSVFQTQKNSRTEHGFE